MLDRWALGLIGPGIDRLAAGLVRIGVRADALTWVGFGFGMAAAACIAFGHPLPGLALILSGRLCDGLDGAVARATRPTDRGAFLDITLDFLFYASIPLAFAFADPAAHALPAAVLLAAFMGTASSFLAFAVMAERRGLPRDAYPTKGLHFLGGLTEGTETLLCFGLMCLWPAAFPVLALGFSLLCALTVVTRVWAGWTLLR